MRKLKAKPIRCIYAGIPFSQSERASRRKERLKRKAGSPAPPNFSSIFLAKDPLPPYISRPRPTVQLPFMMQETTFANMSDPRISMLLSYSTTSLYSGMFTKTHGSSVGVLLPPILRLASFN